MRIAEACYGLAPIFPAEIGATLDASDLLPIRDQPRAAGASLDFAVENSKPAHSTITSQSLPQIVET